MSNKFMMFIPLENQPELDAGFWLYNDEALTMSSLIARIKKELDLPDGVVSCQNGVWGLTVEAMKVTL